MRETGVESHPFRNVHEKDGHPAIASFRLRLVLHFGAKLKLNGKLVCEH
jgi:hypothetical protein